MKTFYIIVAFEMSNIRSKQLRVKAVS